MSYRKRFFSRFLAMFLVAVLLLPNVIPAVRAEESDTYPLTGGGRERHERIVSDTLRYGHMRWTGGGGRQSSHFLTFNPGGDIRPIVSGGPRIFGTSNINAVIRHAQSQGHNVIGGVNADFFAFQTGVTEGLYISNGQLRSSHHGRSAVFFRADGSAFVGNPTIHFTIQNRGRETRLPFLNKSRQPHWFYLYDEHFSDTTRTNAPGREIVFRILGGRPRVGGSVYLEVVNIINSTGAIAIPRGHMILSVDRRNPELGQLDHFTIGDRATLRISSNDARVAEAAWATGGGNILVSGGRRTSRWDAAIAGVNPRTALGIRPDGSVILYTVDGRQPGHSVGLTLSDLADELVDMGATYVVNLDGGGSTTFAFRYPGTSDAAVRNRPSGGALRGCANFILLTAPSGNGRPTHIQFYPTRVPVLAGSLVTARDLYERLTVTDRGYFPLRASRQNFTAYEAPAVLGQQEGNGFRTASEDALGRLTAHTEAGARGHMELNLISRPDRIEVRIGDENLSTLRLAQGDRVRLSYHALVGGREIASSRDAYEAILTGSQIGTLDASGFLTISGNPGARGGIEVSAGGTTRMLDLVVARFFADTDGHWAEDYIGQMRNAGVITGISTEWGTRFFPNRGITRAEFATMLARLLELDTRQYSLTGQEFLDNAQIPNWARPYVAAVYHEGLMTGRTVTGGVRFDAGSTITRAEAFTAVGRLFDIEAPPWILGVFTDADEIPAWARDEIAKLVQEEIVTGFSDGRLAPLRNISRAETATLFARLDPAVLTAALEPTPSPTPSPSPTPTPTPAPSPTPTPTPTPPPTPPPTPEPTETENGTQTLRVEPARLGVLRFITGRREEAA